MLAFHVHHVTARMLLEADEYGCVTDSAVYAALLIGTAVYAAALLGGGVVLLSRFAIALAGTGLLTTVGVIVSMDTFGPVSDNAQGIAEMSGDVHGEGAAVLTRLDAVGNSTKAITKGIAIATAVLAATALFGAFRDAIIGATNASGALDILNTVKDPWQYAGMLAARSASAVLTTPVPATAAAASAPSTHALASAASALLMVRGALQWSSLCSPIVRTKSPSVGASRTPLPTFATKYLRCLALMTIRKKFFNQRSTTQ
jgi:hypothetical protein